MVMNGERPAIRGPCVHVNLTSESRSAVVLATPIRWFNPGLEVSLLADE